MSLPSPSTHYPSMPLPSSSTHHPSMSLPSHSTHHPSSSCCVDGWCQLLTPFLPASPANEIFLARQTPGPPSTVAAATSDGAAVAADEPGGPPETGADDVEKHRSAAGLIFTCVQICERLDAAQSEGLEEWLTAGSVGCPPVEHITYNTPEILTGLDRTTAFLPRCAASHACSPRVSNLRVYWFRLFVQLRIETSVYRICAEGLTLMVC